MRILICWITVIGLAYGSEPVLNTNNISVAKAVEAMAVDVNDEKPTNIDKAVEAAEVAETVRAKKTESSKAQEKLDPWDAFSPPPDTDFDWIQLTSGEWLKGDFKVLYDYVIEFDSDELNLQEFDLEDVKRVRTRNMKTVLIAGEEDRKDTALLRGILEIDGDEIILRRGEHKVEVTRSKLISIADGRQRERDYWTGMLSLGVNARGGNTETTDTTVMANVKRRTALSRFTTDYIANYSNTGEKETANNQRLSGYFDRFLTAKFYWQVLSGEYYRDPFSNIDGQYSVSTGAGYDLIHSAKTEWTLGLGLGYQQKEFVSVEAGEEGSSASPFVETSTRFDHEISGNLDFVFDYSFRFLNRDNGQYTHHMLTKFSFDLIKDLDLDISIIWDRIEEPQKDKNGVTPEQDDHQLVVSLAYDF